MCVPCDDNVVDKTGAPSKLVKMERALVIRKDVVIPRRLDWLCTWGGGVGDLDGFNTRLRKYRSKMSFSGREPYATIDVKYEEKSGRLFSEELSLQSMPRKIRNFIIDSRMQDIDIMNSAPTIIAQVCKLNSIETPCLDHFNMNYHRLLSEMKVTNKKKAKACIFFGSVASSEDDEFEYNDDGGLSTAPWLGPLTAELDNVVFPSLKELGKYRGLENMAISRDRQKRIEHDQYKRQRRNTAGEYRSNVRGIFLSLLYFMEENAIITRIDNIGRRLGLWDNRVSMQFDGLLVMPKLSSISLADLDMLSMMAHQETGIKVRLDFKETSDMIDVDITKIPEERVVIDSHREAAEMMMYLLDGTACREGSTVFVKRDGMWTSNSKDAKDYLMTRVNNANIKIKVENAQGEWTTNIFSSNGREAAIIAKLVQAGLPHRENFGRDLVLDSAYKVLFKNGYYQFMDEPDEITGFYGRFVHGGTFESGVRVPHDFPLDVNEEDIEFVKSKYFDEPFDNAEPGLKENFLCALARAMAGTPEKITNMLTGPRNCGKSIILQLMKHCFGGYVTTINSSTFQVTKGSSDSTRDYSWIVEIEHCRVVFMSETATTDKGGQSKMCGNKLKQLQSVKEGAISGRRIYNDPRTIFSLAKAFPLNNDVPTYEPVDSYKMVHPYNMVNQFVSQQEYDMNRHQPTFKLADPRVEHWYKEDKYRDALILLILRSFNPSEVVPTEGQRDNLDVMEEEVASSVYDDCFTYTGNVDDRVDQKEARTIIIQHIPQAKHSSIKNEFYKRVRDINHSFELRHIEKRRNSGKRWYCGLKIRTMADDQNPQQGGGGNSSQYATGFFPGR